jgi:FKBP-type peptidyl-prolyl cis-trans isomerase FklB
MLAGLGFWVVSAVAETPAPALQTTKEQLSYATGVSAVRNFTKNDIAFELDLMIQGMRDAVAGKDLAMGEKQMTVVLNQLQTDLRRSMAANHRDLAEKNRKRGSDFLDAYKRKPDANAMSNGVLYRVLKDGNGLSPVESDQVITRYRGTSIDGVEFDETDEGKTSTLRVNQVIMGWREALKRMKLGSKWEIVVPSQLAYGERGVGQVIGPNETLVFEVELLDIKK